MMMTDKRKRLTKKQVAAISALLKRIVETDGGFGLMPPMDVSRIRSLLETDAGFESLLGTRWYLRLRDGRSAWLDFTEVVVLLYNYDRLKRRISANDNLIGFSLVVSLTRIMRRDVAQRVFEDLEVTTDPPPPNPPIAVEVDGVVLRQTLVSPERRASLPDVPGLEQDMSDDQLRHVADMVKLIATTGCNFKVFPPRDVVNDPKVLTADDVVERLLHTKWWLAFDDGREELVSFIELMAMTHQLILLHNITEQVRQDMILSGQTNSTLTIDASFNLWELMQPDVVQRLLSCLSIEGMG